MAPPGGGGGGGGSGAAGAGTAKGKTVKAGTGHDCDADRARPRRSNAVYVVTPRDDNEWNKWKTVLENFKKYMDEHTDLAAEYGANCDNSGWDDVKDQRHYYKGQTVADVVRCRVMSVAWAFANRWDMPGTKTNTDDTQQMDPEEENMLRCEVANTFGHLLQTKYCPGQNQWIRGVEYSRIAFTKMNSSGQDGVGEIKGPVIDGTCTACGYKGHERLSKAINWNLVDWLLYDAKILDAIQNIEGGTHCHMKWADYTKDKMKEHDTTRVDEEKINDIKEVEKNVVDAATKAIEKVKAAVEEEIQQKQNEGTQPAEAGGGDHKGQKPSSPSPEGTSGPATSSAQPRSDGSAAENGVTSAPVPIPQAPPAAPPRAEGTGGKPGSKKPEEGELDCENEDSSGVPAGTETHAGSSVQRPRNLALLVMLCAVHTGKDGANGPGSSGSPSAPAEAAPTASEQVPAASDPTSSSTGTETTSNATPGAGNTVPAVDGGNEDPPPLNPPKPKPNPNPDQSGSSGGEGKGGGDVADGVSGGEGKEGGDGTTQGSGGGQSSGTGSTGPQNPGSSGPGSDPSTQPNNAQGTGSQPTGPNGGFGLSLDRAPAVGTIGDGYAPATPTENTSGHGDMNSGGGPDAPDLTGTVLTATTPILFFLTSVIVAHLGYSLWKVSTATRRAHTHTTHAQI
ncbi:hypothetical protein AK88_05608 [Plasmodium fragile]|uniref:Schizont-infected cell agglutination extracellular alpha domain-containing protein n=1 Tax=Plasmodium fragile TaxID=5857 RepID=A0A0D9QD63_PLAFR|nr:uncharacterized protein AK88_05608 [Plasmodium fragile]KJP84762.1 hypothetical protein AK88_05608 [Plasmodium fragile]